MMGCHNIKMYLHCRVSVIWWIVILLTRYSTTSLICCFFILEWNEALISFICVLPTVSALLYLLMCCHLLVLCCIYLCVSTCLCYVVFTCVLPPVCAMLHLIVMLYYFFIYNCYLTYVMNVRKDFAPAGKWTTLFEGHSLYRLSCPNSCQKVMSWGGNQWHNFEKSCWRRPFKRSKCSPGTHWSEKRGIDVI